MGEIDETPQCVTQYSTLKMKAGALSGNFANFYKTIPRHIPGEQIVLSFRCKSLKHLIETTIFQYNF